MTIHISSVAESKAKDAEAFPCFNGFNLLHIKREVAHLLSLIGRDGIFDQYTKHDISHIDAMLELLTVTVIPPSTMNVMTPADWLMIVLAIYFHDLGMLVTRKEYEQRHDSSFPAFRQRLLSGDQGINYEKRLQRLPKDEKERFLYQEFVRENHAARIRAWVTGQASSELGVTPELANAVSDLLRPLGHVFCNDLGLVAESHHRDDLGDLRKYKTSQPYGMQPETFANLHYSALLLRTTDLLHMTSDRTPSILFKAISPSDPLSQREWAKQAAVRSVRSQVAKDPEGKDQESLTRDTIEVHATFSDEEGFFGLSSFLNYADHELRQNYEWSQQAQKQKGVRHELPWRRIDQQYVDTEGFLKEQLSFDIDTFKILELLTGHTLYNDTGVVLREMVQNALDAVRLEYQDKPGGAGLAGHIKISWNSHSRELAVADNGTGMNEYIIKNYLLRVGSSRYQDPKFEEDHPGFSPISRFGIGALSAFMIADEVEYITHYDDASEPYVRRMLLRSLHGKYLTRLLPKVDPLAREVVPHGTHVKLKLRPTAQLGDIRTLAQKWIVVPGCKVWLQIDGNDPEVIGFEDPRSALVHLLQKSGILDPIKDTPNIRVDQRERNGVTLAYALRWAEHFNEWNFVRCDQARIPVEELELGICIEGIRITESTPGLEGKTVLAIANTTGRSAPKTNVARSGLESTPEEEIALEEIYRLYFAHIEAEMHSLVQERCFSLTWAAGELRYIIAPLFQGRRNYEISNERAYDRAQSDFPDTLIEVNGNRSAISHNGLGQYPELWTVDCEAFRSVERLLREFPGNSSLSSLSNTLGEGLLALPNGPLVCDTMPDNYRHGGAAFRDREVVEIIVAKPQRRIDMRWAKVEEATRWIDPRFQWPKPSSRAEQIIEQMGLRRRYVAVADVVISRDHPSRVAVNCDEDAVEVFGSLYVLSSSLQRFLAHHCRSISSSDNADPFWIVVSACELFYRPSYTPANVESFLERSLVPGIIATGSYKDVFKLDDFVEAVRTTRFNLFSTSLWSRGEYLE